MYFIERVKLQEAVVDEQSEEIKKTSDFKLRNVRGI